MEWGCVWGEWGRGGAGEGVREGVWAGVWGRRANGTQKLVSEFTGVHVFACAGNGWDSGIREIV